MNIITGLPRSGSTLLCNILNQNPKFNASSTSILPQLCSTLIQSWSTSPDFRGNLQNKETEKKLVKSMRAFCASWHEADKDGLHEGKVLFDKSRGWAFNLLALWSIYPDAKVIVVIRDLRNVYASIEKQHRKNGLLDEAMSPHEKTIFSRADMMFSPNNLIGGPLVGIQDVIQRGFTNENADPRVLFIKYEELAQSPKHTMSKIYKYLDEDVFKHTFENVKNTATDPDYLYLNKYPHKGEGKVKKGDPDEWKKFMSPDLGMMLMNRFSWFYNTFYQELVPPMPMQQPGLGQGMMNPQRMGQQQPPQNMPSMSANGQQRQGLPFQSP